MRNITVFSNRLDKSNGIVEHVLEMKVKKTPWYLRFAGKMKMAAAVVVGVVGIGLFASPFLLQANDEEEKTNNAPEVSCLWVENHGSIGFTVDFVVSAPSDSDRTLTGFRLCRVGAFLPEDEEIGTSVTLESDYCSWLSIPGFDGGPPLPYPGYLHSFDFIVKGLQHGRIVPLGGPDFRLAPIAISGVNISLYVTVDSEGALESMSAYAYDGDGDFYEIPLYYSPGGSDNFRTFED